MKLDAHIHCNEKAVDPARLLRELREAGVDGGCVISIPPKFWSGKRQVVIPAAERLERLLAVTRGQRALFPLFWVDPIDPGAAHQVERAALAGAAGFKVICSEHAPGDPRAMPVYRAMAALDKPVLFHSGILWDGCDSSAYNRPAAFEALLEVPRLRFALAHMSWPWLDECLAVYGKFQNATAERGDVAEMFIDLTPGTPPIYREEALTKLFRIGYDVADNVLFGTDTCTQAYNVEWSLEWQERDREILGRLGIGADVAGKYFGANLQRWLSGARAAGRPPQPGR